MGAEQGSTLYGGSVTKAAIYEIAVGTGFTWGPFMRTEINVDALPRQLTRAAHAGDPITENVNNPRLGTDFPAGTTVLIDGRNLSVVALMVPDEFTTTDWLDTFPDYQPSGLAIDLKLNPKILSVIFNRIMEATKTQVNTLHVLGDDALISPNPLRFYDGMKKLILADADATQVGTPVVLTAANILDEVFELRNAVDPRLRAVPGLTIFMSYEDLDLLDEANRDTQNSITITQVQGIRSITQSGQNGGIPIVPQEGIPKDFMFVTIAGRSARSNLVQGVWVPRDIDTLKLYREVEIDQNWAILMRMFLGVQHVTGLDIFFKDNV